MIPTAKLRIDLVAVRGEKIVIKWHVGEAKNPKSTDDHKEREKAAPSFYRALQDLSGDVAEICEVDAGEGVRVRAVFFRWKDDVMSASIAAERKLKNTDSSITLVSPYKSEIGQGKKPNARQLLNVDAAKRLHELIKEARAFLDGKREQPEIDYSSPEKKN